MRSVWGLVWGQVFLIVASGLVPINNHARRIKAGDAELLSVSGAEGQRGSCGLVSLSHIILISVEWNMFSF